MRAVCLSFHGFPVAEPRAQRRAALLFCHHSWTLLVAGLFTVAVLPEAVIGQSEKAASRRSSITLSQETTAITGPVDDEGYVQYAAAFNARKAEGVTPESNAAVLVWKALGPAQIPKEERKRFFESLGIAPLPDYGSYFQTTPPGVDADDEAAAAPFERQLLKAQNAPWSESECPLVASWLSANEKPLALLSEASLRPHYFSPRWSDRETYRWDAMLGLMLPDLQELRTVSRALVARAMFRLQAGQIEEARQDLLVCHRLGRLVARDGSLIAQLVGIGLNGVTCYAEQVLAQRGNLTTEQSLRFERELRELAPLPGVAEGLDGSERWTMLDLITASAKLGIAEASQGRGAADSGTALKLVEANIVWDEVLKFANAWYDRAVSISRIQSPIERQPALQSFMTDILAMKASLPGGGLAAIASLSEAFTDGVSKTFVTLLFPAFGQCCVARDRAQVRIDTTRVAFMLAGFRHRHARYPTDLRELASENEVIPVDLYSGKDLIYRPARKGYVLYSVGENGIDNRGATFDTKPEGDDLRVYDSGKQFETDADREARKSEKPKSRATPTAAPQPRPRPNQYLPKPDHPTFSTGTKVLMCLAGIVALVLIAWLIDNSLKRQKLQREGKSRHESGI